MKKIIILIIAVFIIVNVTTTSDSILIPDNALRFRVIANSNTYEDQQIKLKVKDNLENDIYNYLKDVEDVNKAKAIINNNLDNINHTVDLTLKNNGFDYGYKTNLGLNHFPEKEYQGIVYEAGEYDSLVVTLGKGEGDNWWCVLFPPLCLIEAEDNQTDEVEYQFFAKKIIDKFIKNN